jgi:replicative superfamily II helicase
VRKPLQLILILAAIFYLTNRHYLNDKQSNEFKIEFKKKDKRRNKYKNKLEENLLIILEEDFFKDININTTFKNYINTSQINPNLKKFIIDKLENKQQANEIQGLANNLKETKETLAKNYKTIQARNKAEIGLSINRLVNKFFKTDDLTFAQACHKAWDSYYEVTGVHYYGATNSSFEEKLSFLNYLLSL